jgi:hypothetical protein
MRIKIVKKPIPPDRKQLVEDCEREFDLKLGYLGFHDSARNDVTIHNMIATGGMKPVLETSELRAWFKERGFQFAGQYPEYKITNQIHEHFYIGKLLPVDLPIGFHATTRQRWQQIQTEGLRRSSKEIQMSVGRHDTEGNVCFSQALGNEDDYANNIWDTGHGLRHLLCRESATDKLLADWIILEATLDGMTGHRDMFTRSGVVFDEVVAANRLRIVFEE